MAKQKLSEDLIDKVAKLANLPLSAALKKKFIPQLSSVLDYISKVQELNTKDVPETAQVTGLENVFRDDEVRPGFSQEEALRNAPATHNGFVKVKHVFDSE